MSRVVGDDLAHARAGTPEIILKQKSVLGANGVLPTGPIKDVQRARIP